MIVVTGGTGFIGSNVINHLLINKEKVVSVDWNKKKIIYILLEITLRKSLQI